MPVITALIPSEVDDFHQRDWSLSSAYFVPFSEEAPVALMEVIFPEKTSFDPDLFLVFSSFFVTFPTSLCTGVQGDRETWGEEAEEYEGQHGGRQRRKEGGLLPLHSFNSFLSAQRSLKDTPA